MGMALSDIIIIPLRNSTPDINAFSRHLFHMIVELKESKKKDGQIFFPFLISSIRQSTSSKDKIKGNLDNGETIVMDNFFMKMDSIYQNLDGDTLESLYQNSKSDLVKDKVKKCIENVEAIGKEILKKSGL
jgi:cellulose biosynthesis protein BcsQ